MTDLNTNQYIQTRLYSQGQNVQNQNAQGQNQNQPNYGDSRTVAGINYDDKQLEPIKDTLTANPIGKVAEGVSKSKKENDLLKIPLFLALGAIPTIAIDQFCKLSMKGKHFSETFIGKAANRIDKIANGITKRVPLLKFNWTKKQFAKLKDSKGIIGQLINAKKATPGLGMVKDMIMPQQSQVLKEMLDEGLIAAQKNSKLAPEALKAIEELKHGIEAGTKGAKSKAYKTALKLVGDKPSAKFLTLKNRAHSLSNMGKRSGLSKLLIHGYNSVARIFNIGKLGPGLMGKLGPIFGFGMTAYFLGETVKQTIDAPKEEKASTLAHGVLVNFIAGWLLFDPLARFMYKGIGGLNSVKGKGIGLAITKPMNWIGKVLSIGLKKGAPLAKATTKMGAVKNGFIHTGRFMKGFGGGAGRFAIMMFVLFPIIDKIARGITHSIFGKPKTLLAKEKAEEGGGEESAEKTKKSNADALKKALEENKAGMLTVAAKNQDTLQNQMNSQNINANNPTAETDIQSKNIIKNNNMNPGSNPNQQSSEQDMAAKQLYIPAETRKAALEDQKKKEKFYKTLEKTDLVIAEAEKTLG